MNNAIWEEEISVRKPIKSKYISKKDRREIKKHEPSFLYKILKTVINYGSKIKSILVKGGINWNENAFQNVVEYLDGQHLKGKGSGKERSTPIQLDIQNEIQITLIYYIFYHEFTLNLKML